MTKDWSLTHTFINGERIPIEEGPIPVLHFRCGRKGVHEQGDYWFWKARGVIKRCRKGKDPGKPFREMIRDKEENWERVASAKKLRPGIRQSVVTWLNKEDKKKDAKCAVGERCWIGDDAWRVALSDKGKYDLVKEERPIEHG